MAAKQGAHNRLKTKNAYPAMGVKVLVSACANDCAELLPKAKRKVPTQFSLAINPARTATVVRQSPKPSGAKMGAITLPIDLKIL